MEAVCIQTIESVVHERLEIHYYKLYSYNRKLVYYTFVASCRVHVLVM